MVVELRRWVTSIVRLSVRFLPEVDLSGILAGNDPPVGGLGVETECVSVNT